MVPGDAAVMKPSVTFTRPSASFMRPRSFVSGTTFLPEIGALHTRRRYFGCARAAAILSRYPRMHPQPRIARESPEFRRITLALFAAGFSTFALMYCVQPLLPAFASEFQLRPATSSLAISLTTGCLALALLVVGALSEAWG